MSIINEAIKKARNESRIKDTGINADIAKKDAFSAPPIESSESKWTLIVILSLVVTISLLGSLLLYKHVSRLNTTYKGVAQSSESGKTIALHPQIQTSSVSAVNIEDAIELNGIVYGPDDKWAIINNRIVREGDSLLDGKISLIKKDFVKITKDNGEEIVLDLR